MVVSSNFLSTVMPILFKASESHVNMDSVPNLYRRYVVEVSEVMLTVVRVDVQVDDEARVGMLFNGLHT